MRIQMQSPCIESPRSSGSAEIKVNVGLAEFYFYTDAVLPKNFSEWLLCVRFGNGAPARQRRGAFRKVYSEVSGEVMKGNLLVCNEGANEAKKTVQARV